MPGDDAAMSATFLSPAPMTPTPRAPAASAASAGGEPSVPTVFTPSLDTATDAGVRELNRRLRRFNGQVTSVVNDLRDRTNVLAQRVVGVETSHNDLSDGSRSVVGQMIREARAQFDLLRETAVQQQAAIVQEASGVRQGFAESRQAMEDL